MLVRLIGWDFCLHCYTVSIYFLFLELLDSCSLFDGLEVIVYLLEA